MSTEQAVADATLLPRPRGNFRWRICALLFFGTVINYIDRSVFSVLKPMLEKTLHWSQIDYGYIVTAFQLAYAFGYLFGGQLMTYFGVKRGYPVAAVIWNAAAIAQGFAKSIFGFGGATFVLGAAEGNNFPAAIRVVADWFPVKDRALATGLFNSGSGIGAIVCPLVVPWIAASYGWRVAFFSVGVLGAIWVLVWILTYNSPETQPGLSAEERNYIEQGRVKNDDYHIPWVKLLGLRASWAYIIPSALTSPVWWFFVFWFPDFVHTRYHYSTVHTGFFTALMFLISIIGSISSGFLAARLIQLGWSVNNARKCALLVPGVCVLPVFFAAAVDSVWVAVILVGIAAAGHQGFSANLYTLASDLMPKKVVSSLVGLGGFAAGIASIGMANTVPRVFNYTHSYNLVFAFASPMYLIAVLIIQLLVPNIERHKKDLAVAPI